VASASVIEKQNLEGDHSDAPMETETSFKNENKDDVVCRNPVVRFL
jgi:heat shock protein